MIICVEDDDNIRELEVYTLHSMGFPACGARDDKELEQLLKKTMPSLIILDIMLPGVNGLNIMHSLRSSVTYKNIPIILSTAKDREFDKVKGLDAGADDYVTKPFGMLELVSRVKAVLRRTGGEPAPAAPRLLIHGNLKLDPAGFKVWNQDQPVQLTLKEFEVLKKFLENPGRVFTRDQLLNDIWGYDYTGDTRTVDVHIRTLRQKLGSSGEIIETVRGVGYRSQE